MAGYINMKCDRCGEITVLAPGSKPINDCPSCGRKDCMWKK